MRLIINNTSIPIPSWIDSDGLYIEALEDLWRQYVIGSFDKAGLHVPEDLSFGVVLDGEDGFVRLGNRFLVNPVEITEPGWAGSAQDRKPTPPTFKKRYKLDKDKSKIRRLAEQAVLDGNPE